VRFKSNDDFKLLDVGSLLQEASDNMHLDDVAGHFEAAIDCLCRLNNALKEVSALAWGAPREEEHAKERRLPILQYGTQNNRGF
jgi:hypothetical protein